MNSTAWGPGTLRGVHTQTALCGNLSRAISVSLGRTFSFPLVLQADDASLPFSEPLGEIPAPHIFFSWRRRSFHRSALSQGPRSAPCDESWIPLCVCHGDLYLPGSPALVGSIL